MLCPCRRHTGNMTSTTRQQHVQTDPEKPSSSSRSCVMLSIQLTRTVAKSNSRDGEIDVCLVICFHDKEKKDKTKCHRVNTNYLVSSIRRGATVSLSLSIIITIIPSSFCQCPSVETLRSKSIVRNDSLPPCCILLISIHFRLSFLFLSTRPRLSTIFSLGHVSSFYLPRPRRRRRIREESWTDSTT